MRRLTVLNNMQHRQLALRMLSLFTYKTLPSTTAWDDKIARAVYRGSCFPTVNPWGDREDAEPVFFLRGEACKTARNSRNASLLDFGLRVDHAFTDGCNPRYATAAAIARIYTHDTNNNSNKFYASLCSSCEQCADAPPLDTHTMAQHKYIMQIDGYVGFLMRHARHK